MWTTIKMYKLKSGDWVFPLDVTENNGNLFHILCIIKFKISKLGLDIYKYEASL